jgi:hypothetical protein
LGRSALLRLSRTAAPNWKQQCRLTPISDYLALRLLRRRFASLWPSDNDWRCGAASFLAIVMQIARSSA